jgi:hypothetical protein
MWNLKSPRSSPWYLTQQVSEYRHLIYHFSSIEKVQSLLITNTMAIAIFAVSLSFLPILCVFQDLFDFLFRNFAIFDLISFLPYFYYFCLCLVYLGQVVIPVLNSVSPEPTLISLGAATVKKSNDNEGVEEKKTNKSDDRTDTEKRESLLIDQLNKMKFTSPLNFDLD